MKQKKSGEITDVFWEKVAPLLPRNERNPNKNYQRNTGGRRPPGCTENSWGDAYQ
jgi:hypothetical protein